MTDPTPREVVESVLPCATKAERDEIRKLICAEYEKPGPSIPENRAFLEMLLDVCDHWEQRARAAEARNN